MNTTTNASGDTPNISEVSQDDGMQSIDIQGIKRKKPKSTMPALMLAGILLVIIIAGIVSIEPIDNYFVLKDANPLMVKLAHDSGMSKKGELVFLKTHPVLISEALLYKDCDVDTTAVSSIGLIEQGCYNPNSNRIYLREVPANLYNLEVSTAAYEMLHPVYVSLSKSSQQSSLNKAIEENYKAINDSFLNTQVTNFAKIEPGERNLELFSLLATGYTNLSSSLTKFYSRYFSDITKTVTANNQINELFQNDVNSLQATQNLINNFSNQATNEYNSAISAYNESIVWAKEGSQSEDDYYYQIYQTDYKVYVNLIDQENSQVNTYNQTLVSYNTLVTEFDGTQPVSQKQNIKTQSSQ